MLSVGSLVGIVTQLVGGGSPESQDIQRKVIEIFNSRLENGTLKLQREHVRLSISYVSYPIVSITMSLYIYECLYLQFYIIGRIVIMGSYLNNHEKCRVDAAFM